MNRLSRALNPPRITPGRLFSRSLVLLLLISLVGCSSPSGSDSSAVQTQTALSVQATMMAQQAAQLSQQATQMAQQAAAQAQPPAAQPVVAAQPATPDFAATESAIYARATEQQRQVQLDQQATQIAGLSAATEPPPPTEPPPLVELAAPALDFDGFMKSASILLYEDMVAHPDTSRYVKDTLDTIGLKYIDVGSAKGDLKTRLLSNGPQGKGWDLIIIAAESKSGVSGEFFEYVNDALNLGSSVILEVWYLDSTWAGKAASVLTRCGLEFQREWASVPPEREVMFPVNDHPILHEPNDNLAFTKVTKYWAYDYDIGDLMRLGDSGDATILVGTHATEKSSYGTSAVCMQGQLILQTFSSHQLTYQAMMPVWHNYIYNALKSRFERTQ